MDQHIKVSIDIACNNEVSFINEYVSPINITIKFEKYYQVHFE